MPPNFGDRRFVQKLCPRKIGGRKCLKRLCPRIPGAVVLMPPNVGGRKSAKLLCSRIPLLDPPFVINNENSTWCVLLCSKISKTTASAKPIVRDTFCLNVFIFQLHYFLNYCLLDIISFGLNTVSVVSINVTINAVLFSSDLPSSCHGNASVTWLFVHRLSCKFLAECVAVKCANCKDTKIKLAANVVLSYMFCVIQHESSSTYRVGQKSKPWQIWKKNHCYIL